MVSVNSYQKARLLYASFLLCILIFIKLTGCSTTTKVQTQDVASEDGLSLEERWGIKIVGVRLSANGYMIDFRYRVIDPEKASPLFDRGERPYLVDQASGAKFVVPNPPKTGPLRTSDKPQANRNYFILFANPGKYIKEGSWVTVVIGNFKAENLTVE